MGRQLIVDGHNLARSGELPLAGSPGDEEGRAELCALLGDYARGKGLRLTVAFDGRGGGHPDRTRVPFKGGTAVYSARHESADDVIRSLCRDAPGGTVVVTSDRGLAGTLSARAVAVLSAREFAERLFAFHMERIKGASDAGEEEEAPRREKKGEGHREKKRDRQRSRALRKF